MQASSGRRAGLRFDHDALEVVERYPGTGSTDFWGISFAFSEFDTRQPTDREEPRNAS